MQRPFRRVQDDSQEKVSTTVFKPAPEDQNPRPVANGAIKAGHPFLVHSRLCAKDAHERDPKIVQFNYASLGMIVKNPRHRRHYKPLQVIVVSILVGIMQAF